MHAVNMLEAKSSLSRLVQAVEQGRTREVIISRNGRPAARLVPMQYSAPAQRLGIARGRFVVPDSIDAHNTEIAALFCNEPAA